jgi:hypothetical protein
MSLRRAIERVMIKRGFTNHEKLSLGKEKTPRSPVAFFYQLAKKTIRPVLQPASLRDGDIP